MRSTLLALGEVPFNFFFLFCFRFPAKYFEQRLFEISPSSYTTKSSKQQKERGCTSWVDRCVLEERGKRRNVQGLVGRLDQGRTSCGIPTKGHGGVGKEKLEEE